MGVFDRLKEGLSRTREGLLGKITRLVTVRSTIDEELLQQLEEILIGGDVGMATSSRIIEGIRERVKTGRYGTSAELLSALQEEVEGQFAELGWGGGQDPGAPSNAKPLVIMVVGINGVGKTTTIGKLAHQFGTGGKKVVLAAADTFRAAANEQLEIWSQRAGAELIRQGPGADPAAVAYDAVHAAMARGADVVIIDTAGRLHTRVNLMEELAKIRRVMQKHNPTFPHEVYLVIDATTGQNGLQQARLFSKAVGVTGLILTKLDGTAKGGIVLAISQELKIPVRYVGVGETIDDLQPFDPQAFVEALFAR